MADELQREFEIWCENHPELERRKPKPPEVRQRGATPKVDVVQWSEESLAALVAEVVGPAVDRLAEQIGQLAEQIDDERAARRELQIEQTNERAARLELETKCARQDVEIANLRVELARALAGDRRGGSVIDANPLMKTLN